MSYEVKKMHLEGRIAKLSAKMSVGSNQAIVSKLQRRLKNLTK